jgi:nicotinamidase/pyrazinamidase
MKTVFFDIDAQLDFLYPAGALYVPGAERLVPVISRLNQRAAVVVSTTCAHAEEDPEFKDWPPHCVLGTMGQCKPPSTLIDPRAVIPPQKAAFDITGARQVVLQKTQLDLFSNPNLPALLETLAADEYFVYGVVTEYCVRFAALGLLDTGKRVTLFRDAIQSLSLEASERTIAEFTARGGILKSCSSFLD